MLKNVPDEGLVSRSTGESLKPHVLFFSVRRLKKTYALNFKISYHMSWMTRQTTFYSPSNHLYLHLRNDMLPFLCQCLAVTHARLLSG